MAVDPAISPDLAARLAELEDRIRTLESTPPTEQLSVDTNGLLRVFDTAGNEISSIGTSGVTVRDTAGTARVSIDTLGKVVTRDSAGVTQFSSDRSGYVIASDSPTSKTSTSSTFSTACVYEWSGTASLINLAYEIDVPSGTTGEVRLDQEEPSGVWTVVPARSYAGPTFTSGHAGFFESGNVDISTLAAGGAPWRFRLLFRRSAGTGTVTIYPSFPLVIPN